MNTKYISGNTVLKTHSWIILSLIVLIFAFLCNSCSTKANKGTISGSVTLFNDIPGLYIENPMDFSGVTVALYKTAVLDTTLVRINQQYPQIGVQITQETEFDHRNFNPLKVTTTDPIGKFSFPSLTPGDYNLVIWKNEWGIRYICSVKAIENENNNIGNIELYPATYYNSAIVSEPTIFKSDHSYFILTDVNFNSSVEFQPRTQIFINPGCMLKFYGSVTTPEFTSSRDMWKITSGKEIYSTSPVTMDFDSYFSAVNFYSNEINISSGLIRYGSNGISSFNSNSNNLSYFIISDCNSCITFNEGDFYIDYLTIQNVNNYGICCVTDFDRLNLNLLSKCIMYNINNRGVFININGQYEINNCYFININKAIYTRLGDGIITHNNFENNYYNICSEYISNQNNQITYNNFYSSIICIQPTGMINNINFNNFYYTSWWYIWIIRNIYPYSLVSDNVNAKNNYWLFEDVDKYLADGNDNNEFSINCLFYINYIPKLYFPVSNAGIQ